MGMVNQRLNIINIKDVKYQGVKMPSSWVEELEQSNSKKHKISVLEKALMTAKLGSLDAEVFLYNAYAAYNPFWTYNIKVVPESTGLTDRPNPWVEFWALLEAARTRTVTGNQLRLNVERIMHEFDSTLWNGLARRVLLKDLRCGISEVTLNKVLGNTHWKIPTFDCQLANDSNDHLHSMKGQKYLEVKLDGVRVLAVVSSGSVVLYSRNGKIFENFPLIEEAIERYKLYVPMLANGFVLDGEVVSSSFQKLMTQARRKKSVVAKDMVFNIFDCIPLPDFKNGKYNKPLSERVKVLDDFKKTIHGDRHLKVVDRIMVDLSTSEGKDQTKRFADYAISSGYEGIMIKSIDSPYTCSRNNNWLKWKPVHTYDLKVIAVEEGTGKNKGRLGALVCQGKHENKTITVNVGSGFSDKQRQSFWKYKDDIIGHIVEVNADAVTQSKTGDYSLRFPRFVRFRSFDIDSKL